MARTNLNIVGVRAANITDAVDVATSSTESTIATATNGRTDLVAVGANANTGDIIASYNGVTSTLKGSIAVQHDFATDGGAIGTIKLRGGQLPANAYVVNAWYEVLTTYTSGTDAATIGLGYETDSATGIKAAIAISNGANPWDAGKAAAIAPQTPGSFPTKTTATRNLIMTVAVEALTAGALILHVDYVISKKDTTTASTN
jgi:hypothetical protein